MAILHDEILRMLHGGGGVDRRLRYATLALIPTLPEWPRGQQIQLQVAGYVAGVQCGDATPGHAEPVHVVQCAGGRYAAAHRADAPATEWVHCGAHPDSLFEAVLEGLQQRDGFEHQQLMWSLRRCSVASRTDAQWLRQRVADHVERGHPSAMRALQQAACVAAHEFDLMTRGPVTARVLLEILAGGRDLIKAHGGLAAVARHHRVCYDVLRKCVLARTCTLTERGVEIVRRDYPDYRATPSLLPNSAAASLGPAAGQAGR